MAHSYNCKQVNSIYSYNTSIQLNVIFAGKFGIVYKAYYTPEEKKIIEVAVKTVKCLLFKLYRIYIAYSTFVCSSFIIHSRRFHYRVQYC